MLESCAQDGLAAVLSSSSLAHMMLGSAHGRYPSASTVRADEKPISGRERLGSADLTAAAFASDGPLASFQSVLAARKGDGGRSLGNNGPI